MIVNNTFHKKKHANKHLSNEKKIRLFSVYMGLCYPFNIGIIINHYKDPYEPTSDSLDGHLELSFSNWKLPESSMRLSHIGQIVS